MPKRKKADEAGPSVTKSPPRAEMIVPEDIAAILTTEDEQKLYRLIMQIARAAQYCRWNYRVTTRIIDSVRDVRSTGKDDEGYWPNYVKSTEFSSKSVAERIEEMDDHVWNFCLFLRPLYDDPVGKGTVLERIDYILEEFINCMVPGNEHVIENIYEEHTAPTWSKRKEPVKEPPVDEAVIAAMQESKPVKRKRRVFLTTQGQDAHQKKSRKEQKLRKKIKEQLGAKSLENEITIPGNISRVLSTDNEQKVYKIIVKTCEMCKHLNSSNVATFCNRGSKNPKAYAREKLAEIRGQIQNKNYRFTSSWQSYKELTTPEERIKHICENIDSLFWRLDIQGIKANDILDDYDGFNEKFSKIIKECTTVGAAQ
jgi:hypothetical protein